MSRRFAARTKARYLRHLCAVAGICEGRQSINSIVIAESLKKACSIGCVSPTPRKRQTQPLTSLFEVQYSVVGYGECDSKNSYLHDVVGCEDGTGEAVVQISSHFALAVIF